MNEENELINLDVFVAIRLEPVPDEENLYCLVGVLGGEGDPGGDTDSDSEGEDESESDEAFVQLSPPLPKGAADALFNTIIGKINPVRVKEFTAAPARPQRDQGYPRSRQARGGR
ncbi:MAG: hypothetical protein H7145_13355 [Akkermansiaceae bacterium]|nr:hypothetical protein [Armatimonadota bacterium]